MDIELDELFKTTSEATEIERERVTKLATECKKNVLHAIRDQGDYENIKPILEELLRDIQNGNC